MIRDVELGIHSEFVKPEPTLRFLFEVRIISSCCSGVKNYSLILIFSFCS